MSCRFSSGLGAVVAAETIGADTGMAECCRRPARRFVAIFADIVRRDVVRGFSGRRGTIVTAEAVVADAAMVERRRGPGGRFVTILAGVVGCDMVCGLAGGPCAVMATEAIGADARMIKFCATPRRRGRMAVLAGVARRNMVGRFARSFDAIVAAETITRNATVVETGIGKSRRIVAVFAAVARLRVVCGFANRFLAVVAGYAGFGNAAMVETADRPFIGRMAGIACPLRCNVIGILARGPDIVMAAGTPARRPLKNATLVAGFAGNLRMSAG